MHPKMEARVERQKLIGRARHHKEEIEQLFRDVAHWNERVRKPDELPIDPDPDGELGRMLRGINRMLETEARRAG